MNQLARLCLTTGALLGWPSAVLILATGGCKDSGDSHPRIQSNDRISSAAEPPKPEVNARPAADSVTPPATIIVRDTVPTCPTCRLTVTRVVTLGSPQDSVIFQFVPRVLRDSKGWVYAAEVDRSGKRIHVYSPDGRFAGYLGRTGSGPGEYHSLSQIAIGPGDTVYVLDHAKRLSVFVDRRVVKTMLTELPTSGAFALIPLGDGQVMASAAFYGGGRAGLPVHILNSEGKVVRSFGGENVTAPFRDYRTIARAPGGRVWIGETTNYRFEVRDTLGTPITIVAFDFPWKGAILSRDSVVARMKAARGRGAASAPRDSTRPSRKPNPSVPSFFIDSAGYLWATVFVAAKNWQDVRIQYDLTLPAEDRGMTDESTMSQFDTRLDIVDTKTMKLVYSSVLPGRRILLPDGLLSHVRFGQDGYIGMEVQRVELQRRH